MTSSPFNGWLKKNLITLLVLLGSLAFGYGMLSSRVAAIEHQHNRMENKLDSLLERK